MDSMVRDARVAGVSLDCEDHRELAVFYARLLDGHLDWVTDTAAGVSAGSYRLVAQRVSPYTRPTWPGTSIVHLDLTCDPEDLPAFTTHAERCGAGVGTLPTRRTMGRHARPRWASLLLDALRKLDVCFDHVEASRGQLVAESIHGPPVRRSDRMSELRNDRGLRRGLHCLYSMQTMLIHLVEASPATFAEQISAQIRLAVARGDVLRGERLPSAKELAAALGINMHTVLRAYDSLRESGIIDLRRGRGAVVVGGDVPAVRSLFEALGELVSDAGRLGINPAELSALVKGMA